MTRSSVILSACVAVLWLLPQASFAKTDGWDLNGFLQDKVQSLTSADDPSGSDETTDLDFSPGLVAQYYADTPYWGGNWPDAVGKPVVSADDWTFTNYRKTRIEPGVNKLFTDRAWFSIRWQGYLDTTPAGEKADAAEYKIEVWADDGCRVTLDDKPVIDSWVPANQDEADSHRTATIFLTSGKHKIVVEYFEGQNLGAGAPDDDQNMDPDPVKLYWECPARHITRQIIPAANFSHTTQDLAATPGRSDAKEAVARLQKSLGVENDIEP